MRKIFTNLKSVVALAVVAAMTLSVSCMYDDTALTKRVDKVEKDLAALTKKVNELETKINDEVASLTALINGKAVVTSVETDANGNTTVTLSDGKSFVIEKPATFVDTDTNTTLAAYAEDGVYYWAFFEGETFVKFLLVNEEKVPVFPEIPEGCDCEPVEPAALAFKIDESTGNLLASVDGGATWVDTGVSTVKVSGACLVESVVLNEDGTATFTFADGRTFVAAVADVVEFEATRSALYVRVDETIEVPFTINDAVVDINVMNEPLGWKATVEEAVEAPEVEGDDFDMGVLAAGGKNYVLKISGPSSKFVKAGYAEKSGKVSVHFNTAAGSCKVLNVDVTLAELALAVDKKGNITIENTIVDRYIYSDWMGTEEREEFNNYIVAVVDYDAYNAVNGDLASVFNSSETEFDIPGTAGFVKNIFFNMEGADYNDSVYVEGEHEKWTVNFTVAEVLEVLDWEGTLTYEKNSFMVCAIPTDVNNEGALLWDQMVTAPFKQLNVKLQENVDNRKFNNAYFDVTFRGAESYFINPMTMDDVNRYINNYGYPSMEMIFWTQLESYLMQPQYSSFGYKISTDVVNSNIALSELIALSDWPNFDITPGTDYVMCLFVKEEGKTDYTIEDLKFVEFSTSALVPAVTPFEVSYETGEDQDIYNIDLNVKIPENIVAVYSRWEDEKLDEEALFAKLLDYATPTTEKELVKKNYLLNLHKTVYEPATKQYLSLMLVDTDGNYTIVTIEAASSELVINNAYTPTIESVKFAPASATITVGGLEGAEVKGYQCYIVSTDASSSYNLTQEKLADIAYGDSYMYNQSKVNPIVVKQAADYKKFTDGATYKVAVGVQYADGSYSNCVYGEFECKIEIDTTSAIAITEFKYVARCYELDDNPETSGGDYVYDITCADGKSYRLGMYWSYVNDEDKTIKIGTYNYCTNYFDAMYSGWDGFVIESKSYYHDSSLKVEDGKIILSLVSGETTTLYLYEGAITM